VLRLIRLLLLESLESTVCQWIQMSLGENIMSTILIQDLADSVELDQAAMSVIYGGASSARRAAQGKQQLLKKRTLSLLDRARENQRPVHL